MASQLTISDVWIGRDAFYEERVACRPRENDRFYQRLVRRYYSFLVPPGSSVLEMGCGLGDLLAEVKPAHGVGVDFSAKTVALARERHPELEFQMDLRTALDHGWTRMNTDKERLAPAGSAADRKDAILSAEPLWVRQGLFLLDHAELPRIPLRTGIQIAYNDFLRRFGTLDMPTPWLTV